MSLRLALMIVYFRVINSKRCNFQNRYVIDTIWAANLYGIYKASRREKFIIRREKFMILISILYLIYSILISSQNLLCFLHELLISFLDITYNVKNRLLQ